MYGEWRTHSLPPQSFEWFIFFYRVSSQFSFFSQLKEAWWLSQNTCTAETKLDIGEFNKIWLAHSNTPRRTHRRDGGKHSLPPQSFQWFLFFYRVSSHFSFFSQLKEAWWLSQNTCTAETKLDIREFNKIWLANSDTGRTHVWRMADTLTPSSIFRMIYLFLSSVITIFFLFTT